MVKSKWRIGFGLALAGLSGCASLPQDAVQRIDSANAHYQAARYDDARRALNTVIARYPKSKGIDRAYYVRGMCSYRQNQDVPAQQDMERALAAASEPELLARIQAQLGHLAYQKGDYRSAVQRYSTALKSFPDRIPKDELYYRYGDALQKIGQWQEARIMLPKVWAIFPGSSLEDDARRKFAWMHDYYSIQCGVFDQQSRARELADELRTKRLDATTEGFFRNQRPAHAVYTGSYPSYDEARKALLEVRRTVADAFIVP